MKLSKNIVSNISTDYNKIKPKNVSKPNNHKKQQKVTATMSGNHQIGLEFDSQTGQTDTNAQINDNNFTVSLSETTDGGITISSSFQTYEDGSDDLDTGVSLQLTDGSNLVFNASNASGSQVVSVPDSAADSGADAGSGDIGLSSSNTTDAGVIVSTSGELDLDSSGNIGYTMTGTEGGNNSLDGSYDTAGEDFSLFVESSADSFLPGEGEGPPGVEALGGSMTFMTINTKNYDSEIISDLVSNSDTTTQITIENKGKIVNNGIMKNIKQISGDGDIVLNNANVDSFQVESHPDAHFIFNTLNSYLHHNKYLKHFNSSIENNKKIYKLKKPTLFFDKYKNNHKTTVIISKLSTKDEVLNLQNNNLIVGINLINRSSIILPMVSLLSFYISLVNNHKLNLKNEGSLKYYYNPNNNNSYSYGNDENVENKFQTKRVMNSNIDQINFGNIRRNVDTTSTFKTVNYYNTTASTALGVEYHTAADFMGDGLSASFSASNVTSATTNENFSAAYTVSDDLTASISTDDSGSSLTSASTNENFGAAYTGIEVQDPVYYF